MYRADTVGSLLRPEYLLRVQGLTPDPEPEHIPVPFHDESGDEQSVFRCRCRSPRSFGVTG